MTENYEEEIDLWEIVAVLKKRWSAIAWAVLIAGGLSVILALLQPHRYKAEAILLLGRVGTQPIEDIAAIKNVVTSPVFLQETFAQFSGKKAEPKEVISIKNNIEVSGQGRQLVLNTFGLNPEEAERLGEVVARQVILRHQKIFKKAEEQLENYRQELARSRNVFRLESEFYRFSNEPTILDIPPHSDTIPVNSRRKVVMVGLVLGLLLGIFWAFLQEYLDKKRIAQ